jgi:hypothetical protein
MKFKTLMFAFGATGSVFAAAPALAQDNMSSAEAYRDGVHLGRGLQNAGQCTGSGDYRAGCIDGVQESQFDREADQAMDSIPDDSKPAPQAPLLSPPAGLFQPPFSKPDDGGQPNN